MDQHISYIVVALIPDDLSEKLDILKKKYNLYNNSVKTASHYVLLNEGHITLKRAFYMNIRKEHELIAKLESVSFTPILITSESLDVFNSPRYGNVLVAKIIKNTQIQQLHIDICNAVEGLGVDRSTDNFEQENFTPHISVLYNTPHEILAAAYHDAKESIIPLTFSLERFFLLRTLPEFDGERELVKEFKAR